ncbi:MAG: ATP-binding cassette domain-containing protein [Trueperaceae bacterium]
MERWIEARDVAVHEGGRVLLRDASWRLGPGQRWALWGPNGSGKSTLLRVVAGVRAPDDGTLRRQPGLVVASVAQIPRLPAARDLDQLARRGVRRVRILEEALREEERRLTDGDGDLERYQRAVDRFEDAGGYRADERLRRALREALPDVGWRTPLTGLGVGQRRRVAIQLAIAERPDLLLLDEPTHDLDASQREALAARLAAWPREATLVVASHDRELMACVANASARIAGGRLDARETTFDAHREQLGVARVAAQRRARTERRERDRLQASAERMAQHGAPATVAAARSLRRRAERSGAVAAAGTAVPAETVVGNGRSWSLPASRARSGAVLRAERLRADGRFDDVRLHMAAGEALVLLADARDDASTLLAMLAGERASDDPRGGTWLRPGLRAHHWDAHRRGLNDLPLDRQIAAWVRSPRVPSLLALVGLAQERWSARPSDLSGGEHARAALALLIAREPDVILLDRPERDLDLQAIELLEPALTDADATLVLVTDDLRLADAVSTDLRTIQDGRVVAWRGGVTGWRRGRRRREPEPGATGEAREATGAETDGRDLHGRERSRPDPYGHDPNGHDPYGHDRGATGAHDAGAPDAVVEGWEDRQALLEAVLADPGSFGERERLRVQRTVRDLVALRMQAYDARLPRPTPRFRARWGGLVAQADRNDGAEAAHRPLRFACHDWPARPSARALGDGVLLDLPDPPDGRWIPWAWREALLACADLIVPALYPAAVQLRAPEARFGPPPPPFVAIDDRWWGLVRSAWLQEHGIGGRP